MIREIHGVLWVGGAEREREIKAVDTPPWVRLCYADGWTSLSCEEARFLAAALTAAADRVEAATEKPK